MSKFFARECISPWVCRKTNWPWIIDRIALLFWAVTMNVFLYNEGIRFFDVPTLVIEDIKSKNGYFSEYQTLITAMVAFFAAWFAYRTSIQEKRQRSYNTAFLIQGILPASMGNLEGIKQAIDEGVLMPRMFSEYKPIVDASLDVLEKIKIEDIAAEIAWHISSLKYSLTAVSQAMSDLEKVMQGSEGVCYIKSLSLNKEYFLHNYACADYSYREICEYVSQYVHHFPPYQSYKNRHPFSGA